jgi:Protein of unknown function (DUF3667)
MAPLCRNCGAVAPGTYCPACGQETSLALPTVRAMLREAAGRYVAFDGRMWRTLFGLLFRPGFLTREYLAGRRRRYIRPARLFLVLSIALFALLRFAGEPPLHLGRASADAGAAAKAGSAPATSADKNKLGDDATTGGSNLPDLIVEFEPQPWAESLHRRAEQFNHLPREQQIEQIFSGVLRYGPYAMFALLPLFALLLKLVYFGRARRYPDRPRRYAAHLVFGAHNHAFLFLVAALLVLLPGALLHTALVIGAIVYLLCAMHAVYGGRWSGVLARSAVIFLVYMIFFGMAVTCLLVVAILAAPY